MAAATSPRDVVLFLGAGFSFTVGVPTMSQFSRASAEQFATLVRRHVMTGTPLFEDPRTPAVEVATSAAFFETFRQFATRASAFVDFNVDNLEDLFCMAEMMEEAGRTLRSGRKEHSFADIVKHIKEWLWDIYKKYPPHDNDFDSDEKPYKEFIKHLETEGLFPQLSVITTNYDLVFEIVSHEAGHTCCYPLDGLATSIADNDTLPSYVHLSEAATAPCMCKLHGSVNWFAPKATGGPLQIADRWSKATPEQPEVLYMDPSHKLKVLAGTAPELVPPTYAKISKSPWLKKMWTYSIDALARAKSIIFVGYSFPQSDGFMMAMMRAAMGSRQRRSDPPHVGVFDPSEAVIQRYKQQFAPLIQSEHLHCYQSPFATNRRVNPELVAALRSSRVKKP